MEIEFRTSGLNRKLPMDQDLSGIAFGNQREDFFFQAFQGRNAAVETQSGQRRKLDLDHIEPTGGFGGEEEFKAVG